MKPCNSALSLPISWVDLRRQKSPFPYHFIEDIRFTKPLTDVRLTELPAHVVLDCETSREGLTLNWEFNQSPVKLSKRISYKTENNARRHLLIIDDVQPGDEGSFAAFLGPAETHCQLTLECPPRFNLSKDFSDVITLKVSCQQPLTCLNC